MSRIHESSSTALLPQLSLWSTPPTQESVVRHIEYEVRPITTFSSSTPIRFEVKSPANEYTILQETLLWIRLKIKLHHGKQQAITAADVNKTVKLRPNLLHSLFRTVTLAINGKQIILSPSLYSFKAYIETLIGCTAEAKGGHLDSVGWNIKSAGDFVSRTPGELHLDLVGQLHLDLAKQEKWLIGGTSLVLELIPNEHKFYVSASGDVVVSNVDFLDTVLYVHRCEVTQELVSAHNAALMKSPGRYPISRNEVRHMTISSGNNDVILDNVVSGILPRRVFLMLVDNDNFGGANPFKFEHFNLNFIAFYKDGIQFPTKAHTPDFSNNIVNREFLAFYRALNQNDHDPIIQISKKEWMEAPIFGFNFAPDLSNGPSLESHVNVREAGHLRVHLKFAESLQRAIVALLYLEFDSMIEIDVLRNVHVDF